jgi:exo-beta-1,3-glucanase (GH17 family)
MAAARPATRGVPWRPSTIGYNPSGFAPAARPSDLTESDVRRDLQLLRGAGFGGVVTYAADGALGSAPRLARELGFGGTVVMGVWDPGSQEEWDHAASQSPHVDGYCVGNEGLGIRYEPSLLADRMARLRASTGRPVTTSEPIDRYLAGPFRDWLRANSDWLFPIAHPYWADQASPKSAVDWILVRHDLLAAQSGTAVILKEAGVPTAGVAGYSEQVQIAFFEWLLRSRVSFAYFEAFDQPWKGISRGHDAEAHWGLYRSDRSPKPVVAWLRSRLERG